LNEVVAVSVEVCPDPTVVGLADITDGVRAGFTVMVSEFDVTITDDDAVSVT